MFLTNQLSDHCVVRAFAPKFSLDTLVYPHQSRFGPLASCLGNHVQIFLLLIGCNRVSANGSSFLPSYNPAGQGPPKHT